MLLRYFVPNVRHQKSKMVSLIRLAKARKTGLLEISYSMKIILNAKIIKRCKIGEVRRKNDKIGFRDPD